jgi:hypothetical protein
MFLLCAYKQPEYNKLMKEISYDDSSLKNKESEWLKKHRQRITPPISSPPPLGALPKEVMPSVAPQHSIVPDIAEDEEHHFGFIIFVLTLVLAFGIGVGAYVLIGVNKNVVAIPEAPAIENTATNDVQYTDILLSDSPRSQVLVDVALAFKNTSLTEGGVHHIAFVMNSTKGDTRPATIRELFQAIRTEPIPETLFNSLEDTLTYEISSQLEPTGKLTLLSRGSAHTFGAFFDWEAGMIRTLVPLLHPIQPTSYLKDLEGRKFHDERISSIDTRVLFDGGENVVLIYGFTDAKTLVIAGGRDAFLKKSQKIEE